MAVYKLFRAPDEYGHDEAHCTVDGEPINERHDLYDHSPTGIEWGYGGSGPAQLALAMMAAEFGDDECYRLYHHFKDEVLIWIPQDVGPEGYEITSEQIHEWAAKHPPEQVL